jgi:hypothetical protein
MTKIAIETTYNTVGTFIIDLPDGKTWDDVADFYVKWSELFIRFSGTDADDYVSFHLSVDETSTDYKRPDRVTVFKVGDDDGCAYPDYENELACQE